MLYAAVVITIVWKSGEAPFGDTHNLPKQTIFLNATHDAVKLPWLMSKPLKVLIRGLLQKNPKKRWEGEQVCHCDWLKDVRRIFFYSIMLFSVE